MTHLRRLKLLVVISMLLPMLMSCAEMKSWISPKNSVQTSAPVKDPSQTSIQVSAQAANLAKEHMEAGEYQKAIDAYNVEYQKHPHDLSLAREYVKSIENIASAADKALDAKDFASAGRNYDVLLKNYAHFKGFDKQLSFKSVYLNEKLCYCKKAMFKQGFKEYRKGNLSEAIELWQDLLVIDPQNTDIKKALKTARLQQKNLQENE
jgi:tetratricopeptide (TPR) repeat protein